MVSHKQALENDPLETRPGAAALPCGQDLKTGESQSSSTEPLPIEASDCLTTAKPYDDTCTWRKVTVDSCGQSNVAPKCGWKFSVHR
jgi:hypothetical protein